MLPSPNKRGRNEVLMLSTGYLDNKLQSCFLWLSATVALPNLGGMAEKDAERAWRMGSDQRTTFRAWWEDSVTSRHKNETAVHFAND
jgi:hypothetical protein